MTDPSLPSDSARFRSRKSKSEQKPKMPHSRRAENNIGKPKMGPPARGGENSVAPPSACAMVAVQTLGTRASFNPSTTFHGQNGPPTKWATSSNESATGGPIDPYRWLNRACPGQPTFGPLAPSALTSNPEHKKAPRRRGFLEPISGLEPLTYALRMRCSTS